MSKLFNLATVVAMTVCTCGQSHAGPFTSKNKLGDVMMAMAPAYALGMTIMARDWAGTLQLGESILAAQLATEAVKSLEWERRPNGDDKKSFPSGHAAGVFSGAMFVHKRYGWKPALIPYAMGLVTGWSRTAVRAHYWHDIAAGAAISALFTWILVDKYLPQGVDVSADTGSVHVGFSTVF